MKKYVKPFAIVALILSLVFSSNTYGAQIGNVAEKEEYKDLFPDAAKRQTGLIHTYSDLAYDFKLDNGLGQTRVYVDTSKGHSFELKPEAPGFQILDKDGNAVLYMICLNDEAYSQCVANCTETKVINGREFYYRANGDGSEDCFSEMFDCGLKCGIALEIHDGNQENFGLVAFRGEAVEGEIASVPSSDELMKSLGSDYHYVNWLSHSVGDENYPGLIFSLAPVRTDSENGLVVGISSLYNESLAFSGTIKANDQEGNVIGEVYITENCIGPFNTAIAYIPCEDKKPDHITFEGVDLSVSDETYVRWEAESIKDQDSTEFCLTFKYKLFAAEEEESDFNGNLVTFLLLDKDGNVLSQTTDYVDEVAAGDKYEGSISFFETPEVLEMANDFAMFVNPTEIKE